MTSWIPSDADKDRHTTLYDDKIRWLDLVNTKFEPPEGIGIMDEPHRCYRINKKWAKFLTGMVLWLADTPIWKNAQDEGFSAIEAFAEFLVGEDCMAFELRQKPTDSCILQQSLDGGETWADVFDFSLCIGPALEPVNSYVNQQFQNTLIEQGFSPSETTISDNYTNQELDDLGVEADVCNTAGKDAIYSAVNTLVRYINNANVDFLQEVGQAANLADQAQRLISAIPGVGLAPIDEVVDWTKFIVDELVQEYNATVDEALLQDVVCDLFCIAVANDCHIGLIDVFDYFAGKVSPTFSNFTSTLANMLQFALTGTFTGDDYFYFLCYFQMAAVAIQSRFMDVNTVDTYGLQLRAGLNSPDNDWTLFCTDCPEFTFWLYEWDFDNGMGDFTFTDTGQGPNGMLTGGKIVSINHVDHERIEVNLNFADAYEVENLGAIYDKAIGGGSASFLRFSDFENPDGVTLIANKVSVGVAGGTADDQVLCNESVHATTTRARSVRYRLSGEFLPGGHTVSYLRLQKIRIVGSNDGNGKPVGAVWHTAMPDCDDFTP